MFRYLRCPLPASSTEAIKSDLISPCDNYPSSVSGEGRGVGTGRDVDLLTLSGECVNVCVGATVLGAHVCLYACVLGV